MRILDHVFFIVSTITVGYVLYMAVTHITVAL